MENLVHFAPRRLGHLNLFVSDVEKSAAFYRDICGFREVFREPGISMIFMSNGNSHHDVGLMEISPAERVGRDGHVQVKPGAGKTPGLNHLGLEMRTEVDLVQAYRRAKAQGVAISRTTDHQMSHSVYVTDLNGHTLEFYADVVDDWMEFYAANRGELISGHWEPESGKPLQKSKSAPRLPYYRSEAAILAAKNTSFAGLPVRDLQSSLRYYQDVVGMDVLSIDAASKIAVVGNKDASGGDICLVQRQVFPSSRLLFGGVRLHQDVDPGQAVRSLTARNVCATVVGSADKAAVIVLDPDGIPLMLVTCPAVELFKAHGHSLVQEIERLSS
jgi:catechol 2,3-dioxygenase